MSATSFNQLFIGGAMFVRAAAKDPRLAARGSIDTRSPADVSELKGKVSGGGGIESSAPKLSRGLDQRLGPARRFGFRNAAISKSHFDARQRAIVKLHFYGHAGAGGAALKAHARYIDREAAARPPPASALSQAPDTAAHSDYLSRNGRERFYDDAGDNVDGGARAAEWAKRDRRHFRIILAAENGADLSELKPYAREVMARAEAALGKKFSWIAVDHWDTDNPHTHIVLRGRDGEGRHLILPRDFIKHGLRNIARDVASERLGPRTVSQERAALTREARAHRPTRLDAKLEKHLTENGRLRLGDVRTHEGRDVDTALKLRARELHRLGLAEAIGRNAFQFHADWRDRLKAMELHLDIRKRQLNVTLPERAARSRLPALER